MKRKVQAKVAPTMEPAKERALEGVRATERRSRRSTCLAEALRFQLDTCRADEGLSAIVVADHIGFCVAHSGGDGAHDDLAAQLPVLADPARRRSLTEVQEAGQWIPESLVVSTFSVRGTTLHACTVGTPPADARGGSAGSVAVLARVASGFSRLLTQ